MDITGFRSFSIVAHASGNSVAIAVSDRSEPISSLLYPTYQITLRSLSALEMHTDSPRRRREHDALADYASCGIHIEAVH